MNPNPNKETPEAKASNAVEQEPSEGNALGIALRVLYVHAYVQGFNDHKNGIKMDSNHNKDERVATAYDTIATHYKAREAEVIWAVKPGSPALELCDAATVIEERGFEVIVSVPEGDSHFWECNSMNRLSLSKSDSSSDDK